jgi:hypothetical protein
MQLPNNQKDIMPGKNINKERNINMSDDQNSIESGNSQKVKSDS